MATPPQQPKAALLSLLNHAIQRLNVGDLAQAEESLSEALAAAPRDPNVLQLMGVLRRAQERFDEAESFYNQSLSEYRDQPQVHHNLGNLLLARKRPKEAVAAQRRAIRLKPDYIEAYVGLALALSADGDHDGAMAACRRALQIQPDNFPARQLLAAELLETRRPVEAEALLREILADARMTPQAAIPLNFNLALSLKQQGRHEDAVLLLETLRPHARQLPQLDYHLGEVLFGLGRYDAAHEKFRKVLSSEPENGAIMARLALTSSFLGDNADARKLAEQALTHEGANGLASTVLALCEFAQDRFDAGVEIVRGVLADERDPLDDWTFSAIVHAAGQLDKKNRCDESFSLTMALNERRRRDAAYLEPVRAVNDVRRLRAYFDRSALWEASPVPPASSQAPAGHVFILGFMRSGTTLLATALAGHDSVVAADEKDFFSEAAATFLLTDKGLDTLAQLPQAEIARWTQSYWQTVRARGFQVPGKVFIEKMPFNALRLPLVARLFPTAKILLAQRDPRDVVLSCVRQKFDLTPFSYEFLRLGDCAQFYAETMDLVERYRESLPLDVMDCRYEDIVDDYIGTMRRVCAFTGLEWQDAMTHFSSAAGFVDPRSASGQQVRSNLYASSVGQWRRYRKQLEPVSPILSSWISKLNYPAD